MLKPNCHTDLLISKKIKFYCMMIANILTQQGYVVLSIDLFPGEIAADQNRARELTSVVRDNPNISIDNMKSAVTCLGYLDNITAFRVDSMERCFGGQQSLQLE